MIFLGTSAGEGLPNPFCRCRICENARKVGGREIRTRSSFMLDSKTVIDIGADFLTQAFLRGIALDEVENVLFTHMHDDHFNYTFLWERAVRREGGNHPLTVWTSEQGYRFFEELYFTQPALGTKNNCRDVTFVKMKWGETYTVGDYTVMPLRGHHGTVFEETSTNYLIEKDGRTLYYALDSGYFLEDTFAALEGRKLDTLIMECTFPRRDNPCVQENSGHMDPFMCIKTLDRLNETGAITADTAIYFTHISPYGSTHAELCDYVAALDKPYRITVAYDGLEI